jgi:hypothetical protein
MFYAACLGVKMKFPATSQAQYITVESLYESMMQHGLANSKDKWN